MANSAKVQRLENQLRMYRRAEATVFDRGVRLQYEKAIRRLESQLSNARSNPAKLTKAQRATARKKAATERRVAAALANYLKKQNPGMKTAGAKVQKLKGGVLKITPIKAVPRAR